MDDVPNKDELVTDYGTSFFTEGRHKDGFLVSEDDGAAEAAPLAEVM